MADDLSWAASDRRDSDFWLDCERPDLAPLWAIAERAELAAATACVADSSGYPLCGDDPLGRVAHDLARELTLAGFTLHHCAQSDPLYRLGGVCLLPVGSGIAVSWTTHILLSLEWDRCTEHHRAHAAMNRALAEVLNALGFRVEAFGQGGASS
ncbi:MAG: hypothetical protein ACRDRJ_09825 [Streptosporangiaceae bacterium]